MKPQRQSISQICTPLDEAFVLLALEICWDNWLDTDVLFDGKFRSQKRKGDDEIIRSLQQTSDCYDAVVPANDLHFVPA